MQNASRFSTTSKILSSNAAKMSLYISYFFPLYNPGGKLLFQTMGNPDEMAKLHQATMRCRKEAWELEIILFSFLFLRHRSLILSYFHVTRWIRQSHSSR